MKLSDFKILTFDVYGTLIDWETGMFQGLAPLVERAPRSLTRDEVLEAHARNESRQQALTPAMPYSQLLATVYRRIAEEWGIPATWDECKVYGNSVRNWPAFEDSPGALMYLKKHYKLAVLTNVDNESFAHSQAKLKIAFDYVFTAQDIGSYKPAPRNFDYMIERVEAAGIQKSEILHTAESMFHDHGPANHHDLKSAWIYRRHDKEGFGATMNPGDMPSYDFRFNSMADLVKAHQEEILAEA